MTANTEPQQDVISILTTDHREFFDLIAQIGATPDPERQRDLTDTLIAEIVRHSVGEEMYVYPAMRDHLPNGKEAADHDTEEHKEIERTMKSLEGADAGDPEFLSLVTQLEDLLRHHVEDEEREQFPQLRAHLSPDDLVKLGGKLETAKKVAPTRPHPAAPNAALFHKLAGPGVGLVDRLRDKLTGRTTG
ncbi:MAG: hemerythrin domain-containing protein [Actinomycetota bacterium]|nr:hemerythrin domain-containing protein [Actinomycetota bacterium]